MANSKDDQGHIDKYLDTSANVQYENSSTHCSKVISKVQVFLKNWVKLQGQAHRFKNNGTLKNVISQGIFMWNIKALALTV